MRKRTFSQLTWYNVCPSFLFLCSTNLVNEISKTETHCENQTCSISLPVLFLMMLQGLSVIKLCMHVRVYVMSALKPHFAYTFLHAWQHPCGYLKEIKKEQKIFLHVLKAVAVFLLIMYLFMRYMIYLLLKVFVYEIYEVSWYCIGQEFHLPKKSWMWKQMP